MASIGETKKQVRGVSKKMSGLRTQLDNATQKFEHAQKRAEKILDGSATNVEAEVVGKMKRAGQAAQTAQAAVKAAIEACETYASSKI